MVENLSKFFNSFQSSSPPPLILEPNHEIMERFQAAYKTHLLRQKDKLNAEIAELRSNVKKTQKEEDELGVQLYAIKQAVDMQQKAMQERQNRMEELIIEKGTLDAEIKEIKDKVNEERQLYFLEKQKEEDMRVEMEKMHGLEKKVLEWKEEMEGDLAVNLRVSEKTEVDRKKLLEENKRLDMYIFRLMTEVNKLESELMVLDTQLDRKEKEKDILNETIADANADLDALAAEQRRLLANWNSTVVAMSQRDITYNDAVKELNDSEEAFRNLGIEIENQKKSVSDAMRRSEELGLTMTSVNKELENYSRKIKRLLERKGELERNVAESSDLAVQAERDLQISEVQVAGKESELQNIQKELEDLTRRKQAMEDESLSLLLEKATNDKAALHLNKSVKNLRDKVREQEIYMMESENRIAKLIMLTEEAKWDTARNQEILDEMNRDLDAREAELNLIKAETKDYQNQITNGQGKLLILSRKIEELTLTAGSDLGQSPMEIRLKNLKWKLQETKKENEQLQAQWMRQQGNNVKLTQQRSDQLKEISLFRKQVILLDQKLMKTNEELEQEKHFETETQRNIANLQHKLETLSRTLAAKSEECNHVDRDLLLQQKTFVKTLQESEKQQMVLKSDIRDLEKTLEERAEAMLNTQREMLAWEKKVKMAIETKLAIQKEKSDQGDIGQMRQEIHRMEVRFSQLKKVQDKLITDLEQTIRRREAIMDEAEAREKSERGSNKSRANFQRKVDKIRNRLKIVRQEQKIIEKFISEAEENHEDLLNKLNEKNEQVKMLEEEVANLEREIEDKQLAYQQGIEVLVRRQRRCKLYGLLKTGKYRPLYRNELSLENELGIARTVNGHLSAILEALIADFPGQRASFTRMLNSLKPDDI